MKWISVEESGYPKQEGVYFVYAPSLDEERPFYHAAWFDDTRGQFTLIPRAWAMAVTHWIKPIPPKE